MSVRSAVDDEYIIPYKGILCWTSIPDTALIPITRLLLLAIEGTFALKFWAMRTVTTKDWYMGHICHRGRETLEYDGLCSHTCFHEFMEDFNLTAEELQNQAAKWRLKKHEWVNRGYLYTYLGKGSVRKNLSLRKMQHVLRREVSTAETS